MAQRDNGIFPDLFPPPRLSYNITVLILYSRGHTGPLQTQRARLKKSTEIGRKITPIFLSARFTERPC